MPVDLEMLLSSTRSTLFPFSPYVNDHRFSLTSGYDGSDYSPRTPYLLRSNSRRFGFIQDRNVFPAYEKPSKGKAPSECNTRKKKVSFADDRGLNLVEVREIPGAPKWTDDVLALLIGGTQDNQLPDKVWKLSSENPPWADEKLVELLEKNKVGLEMITIKKPGDVLTGTIKVKNLAFEKNVFVRITFDRWLSYTDIKAAYLVPSFRRSTKASEYDTFGFNTKIPPSTMKYGVIELCIGFQCCDRKYWDNNGGINYRLIADSSTESSAAVHRSENDKLSDSKITLSLTENIEKFSEIDSWSNFMYNQPYW